MSKTTDLQVAGFAPGVTGILQFDFGRDAAALQGRAGTVGRHTRRYRKAWEVYPMAALLYVLLAVGYGLSVWSLARQRRVIRNMISLKPSAPMSYAAQSSERLSQLMRSMRPSLPPAQRRVARSAVSVRDHSEAE